MAPPSLRNRIRNGTLLMLAFALVLGSFAAPSIRRLGSAIRDTLYRNYISIEAAQHMHAAVYAVQLAQYSGTLPAVLAANHAVFNHWISVELSNITETGEAELAADIQRRGTRLFGELAAGPPAGSLGEQFATLHQRLDELIAINQEAMFRADSRANRMSERLAYEFVTGLLSLLIFGAALSWTIAWNL